MKDKELFCAFCGKPKELARRLYGKYIALESKHLTKKVQEINDGKYIPLIEEIMNKPIEELKELYNNREIEK